MSSSSCPCSTSSACSNVRSTRHTSFASSSIETLSAIPPDVHEKTGPSKRIRFVGRTGRSGLRQNADDDAAVLRAAVLGLVVRCRLRRAVADHVHLVQRNLV